MLSYDLDFAMRASWSIYDTLHERRSAAWLDRRNHRRHRVMRSIYGRLNARRQLQLQEAS
jgi:hypothetical protein